MAESIDPHLDAACARKIAAFLAHPDDGPDVPFTGDYLIHPPSRLSATSRWIRFRDRTVIPLLDDRPGDLWLRAMARQIEKIIAWRATQPPEDRFWKAD